MARSKRCAQAVGRGWVSSDPHRGLARFAPSEENDLAGRYEIMV